MIDTFVKSYTHLKDRPKADQALPLLQRIASLVKPIMRKRSWVLPVLAEFFPESPNLLGLNVNGGQKILLRLRPAWAPDTFYDEDDLVHTMLHELTHNVHGPHDQQFYKYLAGLEDEYENLKRSGYDGEGFFSRGRRLGQSVSHDLPPHLARQKALEAAEKRKKVTQILGGPQRLGGGIRNGNKTPRELAVQAAERRLRDEAACGSGELAQREADKAARESIEDKVIDLTGDSDDEVKVVETPISTRSTPADVKVVETPTSIKSTPVEVEVVETPTSTQSSPAQSPPKATTPSPPAEEQRKSRPVRFMTPRQSNSSRSRRRIPPHRSSTNLLTPPPSPAVTLDSGKHSHSPIPEAKTWACPRCTLINDPVAVECAACLLIRPSAPKPAEASGWTCGACGEKGNPHLFWSCKFCGAVKSDSSRNEWMEA